MLVSFASIVFPIIGCGFQSKENGFRVFDYETKRTVAKVRSGNYREMVCDQSFNRFFFTITQEGDFLIFKKWDENGTQLNRYKHPMLDKVWIASNWFSISPDGTQLVYWLVKDKSVHVKTMDGSADKVILTTLDYPKAELLSLLAWKDNSHVVLAIDPKIEGFTYSDIHLISLDGTIKKARTQFEFHALRMSPNRKFICGVIPPYHVPEPDWEKGTEIMIFDLDTMKEHLRVPPVSTRNSVMELGWTADSTFLYFTGGAGGGNLEPFLFDLTSRNTTPVSTRFPGRTVVLCGSLGNTLGFASDSEALIFDYSNGKLIHAGRKYGAMVGIKGTTRYVIGE